MSLTLVSGSIRSGVGTSLTNSRLALALTCGVGLLCMWGFHDEVSAWGLPAVAQLVVGVAIVTGALVYRSFVLRAWSLPFLFFLALSLFHCGAYIAPAVLGDRPAFLEGVASSWYTEASMIRAGMHILAAIFSYGFTVGIGAWLADSTAESSATSQRSDEDARDLWAACADVGAFTLLVGVTLWLYIAVASLGASFMLTSYGEYRAATAGFPTGTVYLLIALGAFMSMLAPKRQLSRVATVAFAVHGLFAFMIGLRAEVLIPLTAGMVTYGVSTLVRSVSPTSRMLLSLRFSVVMIISGLLAVSAAQQVRAHGIGDVEGERLNISVVRAVEEMGYSARVLVTSVGWHEHGYEPYRSGATYIAPFERALRGVLGLPRPEASSDYDLMNVEIANRVGQIGGSIIAEAHHNFGTPGPPVVLGMVGLVVGLLSGRVVSGRRAPFIGLLAVLLLMHVRNSFTPMVQWAASGFIVIGAGWALASFRRRRSRL